MTKTYDDLGNVLTVTDEENRTTTYAYDAANELTSVTDALNEVTQYGYDLSGNKTSQIDANGHNATDPTGNDLFGSWQTFLDAVEIRPIAFIAQYSAYALCTAAATEAFLAEEISNEQYQEWLTLCAVATRN